MTVPVITAIIDFSSSPSFAPPLILGSGILGTNSLNDGTGVTVDVSSRVDSITTNRGRNATADLFQTGTLSLRIVDQNGDFNPQNASSPYFGLLAPMRKVTITASYAGTTYPIFAGYITGYQYQIPDKLTQTVGHTVISAVDGFRVANLASITSVAGTSAGQLTGARINNILDQISWPSTMRAIDSGLTTVQADPGTSRTVLEALQNLESTEYGALYMSATGNFVFRDRHATSSSVATTPTVFNDDGSAINYYNAVWVLSDNLVYNSANVTRAGGTMQSASNAASIAQYFLHSFTETGLMMQTDAEALNNALAYVASRANTSLRCDQLVLDLYTPSYAAGITAALTLDFLSPVTITTKQPGSTAITKTEQVFGVKHEITPSSWRTTLMTLEPIIDSFILNSSSYGVLGTSVLSY